MRRACAALVAVLWSVGAPPAGAEAFPGRSIRLVVPFATGDENDAIARVLAEALRQRLGRAVVVDNKGGAAGAIGTEIVVHARPDGYTLLFASASLATSVATRKSPTYRPVDDLAAVGLVGVVPFVVTTSNRLPAHTFGQFVAYARAHPGEVNYGSAGIGDLTHLGTELLGVATGIRMTHVPYKGAALAFSDVIGGDVQMALASVPLAAEALKSGRVRAVAVTGSRRSALLPQVPTVAESGIPGFELEGWWGVLAPSATPQPIVAQINAAINDVLGGTAMREALAREGAVPMPDTPASFAARIRLDVTRWDNVVRDAGIARE